MEPEAEARMAAYRREGVMAECTCSEKWWQAVAEGRVPTGHLASLPREVRGDHHFITCPLSLRTMDRARAELDRMHDALVERDRQIRGWEKAAASLKRVVHEDHCFTTSPNHSGICIAVSALKPLAETCVTILAETEPKE